MEDGPEEVPWSLMALVLVIARLCDSSSELHIAEHFYKDTALCDLLGIAADKINDDRLYRALDHLLPHKEALEIHLKNRLGELFGLEYDILLYDVTSTYFEGQAASNPLSDDWDQVHEGLEVKRCPSPDGQETFILCRSEERRKKEQAIHARFEKRIEEGLRKIETTCSRRTCDPVTIAKRVGRLLGQNSRAAGLFETDINTIRQALGRHNLFQIACNAVADRPGRIEPRVVKRRPKPYPLMTQPRSQYRQIN